MKKSLILCILIAFICIHSTVFSQIATFDWSNRVGTTSSAKKALIDGNGNIYVWVSALPPITIGSTTYTNTNYDNYLVKYDNTGAIIWSKEISIRMFNMCLTKDSTSILISGLLNSNYNNFDLGNGVNTGTTYNSAGIISKIDGSNGNTLWVKDYDATLPSLSYAIRIDAIYETNKGIFCVQGLKIRRLNFDGSEIWNRTITANGTEYKCENASFNSWADDDGNSFYTCFSGNGNTTSITLNGENFTTFGNNNVFRTYFSLDSSGNTNWITPNVNFQPSKNVEVSKNGNIILAGTHIQFNYSAVNGGTNHPFIKAHCNKRYNIFKASLKNGELIWNTYSQFIGYINDAGFHFANDGNLYMLCHYQGTASVITSLGTLPGLFQPINTVPNNYIIRINENGIPDSAFSMNTFSSTNVSTSDFAVVNLFRTNQGKFTMLFNAKNKAITFANGNANQNTSSSKAYQGLIQFTAPSIAQKHSTTWTGATNGNWFTASNWTNGIPTDSSTTIFTSGALNYPEADYQLYNYTTSKWAACGNLIINENVVLYFGNGGCSANGLLVNNGTIIYNFAPSSNSPYTFPAFSSKGYEKADILGNGIIKYTGATGSTIHSFRSGNNTLEISLSNNSSYVNIEDCGSFKNLVITKGNIGFSSTDAQIYVDSSIQYTFPSRVFGGSINVKIRNNQSTVIPIGSSTNIQPATITLYNSTQPIIVSAGFYNTITGAAPNPTTCILNGQVITSTLNGGMWTVTAASSLQTGAYYTANFKLTGSTNSTSTNRYALLKRANSSANWEVAGNYQPAFDSAGYTISSATNISSFSDFAIGIASGALPIYSIKLSGIKMNNKNQLSWSIISTNAKNIIIEKSINGYNFYPITSFQYTANGNFIDESFSEKSYYRLKVIDENNSYKYSNIVIISNKVKNEVLVYPTLIQSYFNVQNNTLMPLHLSIFNTNGILVLEQKVIAGTSVIYINSLPKGTYFYKIIGDNIEHKGKLIKQ